MIIRRTIAGIVIAAGLFSIAVGVQRWFDAHAAESVADALMQAVKSGNRAQALPLLTRRLRDRVELPSESTEKKRSWPRQNDISYTVTNVTLDGDRAIASITVDKDGFVLEPVIHLCRGRTTRWKVDQVDNLEIDPRYLQRRAEFERKQGEELASRLQQALQNRPGVNIQRVSFADEPQPQ